MFAIRTFHEERKVHMETNVETKSNKKKVIIGIVAALVLVILCVVMGWLYLSTREEAVDGDKTITLQVNSQRDSYSFTQEYTTTELYLGDFLAGEGIIGYNEGEFGRYITSVQGYEAKDEEQSWWSVSVNGESAVTGVDEIVLEDGSVYLLELKIGW